MTASNTTALSLSVILLIVTVLMLRSGRRAFLICLPHNVAWIIALLIVSSGLMNYGPTSANAWLLIILAITAFNGGLFLLAPDKNTADRTMNSALISMKAYQGLLSLFALGVLVYLKAMSDHFGPLGLFTRPNAIRAATNPSYLEFFPLYGKVLFYLGPLCLVLTLFPKFVIGLQDRPRWARLGTAAAIVLLQALSLQRTNIFAGLVWAIGISLLEWRSGSASRSRADVRRITGRLVAVGAVGLVAFQGIAVFIGKTGLENPAVTSAVSPALVHSPFLGLLHYTSSGLPAFGRLVESKDGSWPSGEYYGESNPQTWGLATFSGPLKLVPEIRHWNEVSPFVRLPVPTNVFTSLEPWYRDFRWPGILLGPLAVGVALGLFARKGAASPRALLMAGLLLGLTCFTTFTNFYLTVSNLVLYASIFLLGRDWYWFSGSRIRGKITA